MTKYLPDLQPFNNSYLIFLCLIFPPMSFFFAQNDTAIFLDAVSDCHIGGQNTDLIYNSSIIPP